MFEFNAEHKKADVNEATKKLSLNKKIIIKLKITKSYIFVIFSYFIINFTSNYIFIVII